MYVPIHGDHLIAGRNERLGAETTADTDDRVCFTKPGTNHYGVSRKRHEIMSRRRRRETIRHWLSLFPSFQTQKDFSQERQQMRPRCLPVLVRLESSIRSPFWQVLAKGFLK